MNKDNSIQNSLSFFFITIFFVIGAVFAFSNKKKIVDFFNQIKQKDLLKNIGNQLSLNDQNKDRGGRGGIKKPLPLNTQGKSQKGKGFNNSGKDSRPFPKNIVSINEERDNNNDDEDEEEEEENQESNQDNYSPQKPSKREFNNSNSSGDPWLISFFKNIISFIVWFLMLVVGIIAKIFFILFDYLIMNFVAIIVIGFLASVFALMVAAKHISFCDWIPKKCYDFCSSQVDKIDFLNNHQNVKGYINKFLKFILRVDSGAPAPNENNVNSVGGGLGNFFNILSYFKS